MRVDAHQHFWRINRGDYGWLTPDQGALYRDYSPADLAPLLARYEIEETVLVQAAPTLKETLYLLDVAHHTPFVVGVVGWVDLESPEAIDHIGALTDDSYLVGVRAMIQDIADPEWMLRESLEPVLEFLIDQQLAFDALVRPQHLPALGEFLDRYDELRVVIDHGAKPDIAGGMYADWAGQITALANRNPNLFCKLSGLINEAGPDWTVATLKPYVERIIDAFGPERVLWGSDWPVINAVATYDEWVAASGELLEGYSKPELAWMHGDTARHVYRLP